MSLMRKRLLDIITARHFTKGFSKNRPHQLETSLRITDVTNPVDKFLQTSPNETNWRYVNLRVTKLWEVADFFFRALLVLTPMVVMRQHKNQFHREDYLYDDPAKNAMGASSFQERLA